MNKKEVFEKIRNMSPQEFEIFMEKVDCIQEMLYKCLSFYGGFIDFNMEHVKIAFECNNHIKGREIIKCSCGCQCQHCKGSCLDESYIKKLQDKYPEI